MLSLSMEVLAQEKSKEWAVPMAIAPKVIEKCLSRYSVYRGIVLAGFRLGL